MKLCISVGLAKVNVGFVAKVTNTLLELIDTLPDCCKAEAIVGPDGFTDGFGGVGTTGVTGVTGAGVLDWQTEGCPAHEYPD